MPETTANSAVSGPIKLAVIPGDGIGTEVTAEALKVLDVVTRLADVHGGTPPP